MNEDNILIDSENLESINTILKTLVKEEINTLNSINDCYIDFVNNYKSKNGILLEQICSDIFLNMNIVKKNHESNIFLIEKRISDVKSKFNKLKVIEDTSRIDGID